MTWEQAVRVLSVPFRRRPQAPRPTDRVSPAAPPVPRRDVQDIEAMDGASVMHRSVETDTFTRV